MAQEHCLDKGSNNGKSCSSTVIYLSYSWAIVDAPSLLYHPFLLFFILGICLCFIQYDIISCVCFFQYVSTLYAIDVINKERQDVFYEGWKREKEGGWFGCWIVCIVPVFEWKNKKKPLFALFPWNWVFYSAHWWNELSFLSHIVWVSVARARLLVASTCMLSDT